jgi:hypothetical protein
VKKIDEMTQPELGAYVQTHLRERGIDVVLSGGAVVAYYTEGKYLSADLDFVNRYGRKRSEIVAAMEELGFKESGRHFTHPETNYFIEFPPGPLAIGEAQAIETIERDFKTGTLVLISPTESVKDRLAWYYHTGDRQSLYHAVLISKTQAIDLEAIEAWSEREGKLEEFKEFRRQYEGDVD